ncbi:MFS transporter [uncultured Dysosmobacter sp.]|uniref:MFS transporter n=1 Tax=uncultured Dysosmobacter sp. TaxID=2591384 RepID=UPI0026275401|nr:MFS transporter [uncultured Dysosmobacter sp.]
MKNRSIHKAWFILIGCCIIQALSLGLTVNCRGLFYLPILEDFDFGMGALTTTALISNICSCVVLSFADKVFAKIDCRIVLGTASLLICSSAALMASAQSLAAFYIAALLEGIGGAFLRNYLLALLLCNWFYQKTGLAMGIASSFAGVGGVIASPVINFVIENLGWRMSYWIMGGLLLLQLPISIFLLRLRPADVGCQPYGWENDAECSRQTPPSVEGDTVYTADLAYTISFWLMLLAILFISALCAYPNFLSAIAVNAGHSAEVGAWMTSCCMAGNIACKLTLGRIYDRYGLKIALISGLIFIPLSLLLLLINSIPIHMVGSLFLGAAMGMNSVMIPVMFRDVYQKIDYKKYLSYVTMVSSIGYAGTTSLIGCIIDWLGNETGYPTVLAIGIVCVMIIILLLAVSIRGGRKTVEKAVQQHRVIP